MRDWIEVEGGEIYIHPLAFLKILWKRAWIIFISSMLGALFLCFIAAKVITPKYSAFIMMYVNNSYTSESSTSITSSDITASQKLAETYSVLLTRYELLSQVIEETGVSYSYETLSGMISIRVVDDTEIIEVTVISTDAEEAALIAQSIAENAPSFIMNIVSGSSVKIVENARVTTGKTSPNIAKYTAAGFAIGFVISCAVIILLVVLKNGLTVEEQIRQYMKRPVLAVIPQMKGDGKSNGTAPENTLCDKLNFASAESYKLLRTNISFCFTDEDECRVIGITSSVRSEGKSTTAINLAYTLAQANYRVCLIDCDMRLSSVAAKLGLKSKPGLSNLLAGQTNGNEVLQKYTASNTSFYMMAAGDVPPNPSELLGSAKMQSLLEALGETLDYIILDLPPVGVVSDPLTVSGLTNGILFVVREDFYEHRILSNSLRLLDDVNAKLAGVVVTYSTTQMKEYKHYGYKYGYGYGYGYEEKANEEN